MAKATDRSDPDIEALSEEVTRRFDNVPWKLFDSKDLAASGETRYEVSKIQTDLLKVARMDPDRAGQIWDAHVPDFVPRPAELPGLVREEEQQNGIEPGRKRRKTVAEPYLDTVSASPSGAKVKDPEVSQSTSPGATRPPTPEKEAPNGPNGQDRVEAERARFLLDGLNRQYLKTDDKYHFRDKDGKVAFEARETKLVTQHDTPAVVGSMIDLAEARGWSTLKLTGTQDFRREAWLQGKLRDFEVSGYQPTKLDKAKLDELRTERSRPINENTLENFDPKGRKEKKSSLAFDTLLDPRPEPKLPLTPTQDQFLRTMEATMRHRGDAPAAIAKARELANERLTSDRIHVGKFIEVGTAPYLDKRGEAASHFVTLEDNKGTKSKVWGVDLPRALNEADAKLGQLIAVAFSGRKPVSIDVPIKDDAGKIMRVEKREVVRNSWDVVQFDRLRDDSKASVMAAVQRQQNPAALKVFDRSAAPARQPVDLTPKQQTRPRERTR